MNTNQLKKFAQAARRKLLNQVGAKLEYVFTQDSAELREKAAQVRMLREELSSTGKEQLVERVAYTWFNRLMALRFMDANDFQPSRIRIVSPKEGHTLPQILEEAKQGQFPDEIKVDRKEVLDILDGKIPGSNTQNEAFRLLLIAACNALHTQFPFLFEPIRDYTELLLPDDLTSEFSIVHDILQGMSQEDCRQVEIIGWIYQFYISEKKDEVFASKKKVRKEDIPAATQLFTPRWIVEYMVQNTLGKLWLQNRPQSGLREHMPYFIESATLRTDDYLKVHSIEEITLLDQACGSGHILVYAFELLTKIYEEEGYNPGDIPKLIIEKNLYGFEIDERAAQLAGFSLLMKARGYYRRLFRREVAPNILCFEDVRFEPNELENCLDKMNLDLFNQDLQADIRLFEQATNLGSLIQPRTINIPTVTEKLPPSDIFLARTHSKVISVLHQIALLNRKFHCVVDNPPYMGGGNMNKVLGDFVKAQYLDSRSDLMAAFIECGLNALLPHGYLGMINQHSWMFLSSYEKLRKKMIDSIFFDTLLHLGPRTFPEIGGEVVQNASFTFVNAEIEDKGTYIRLVDYDNSGLKRTKTLEAIQNPDCGMSYTANQKDFEKIPGSPIGYWVTNKLLEIFKYSLISEFGKPLGGLQTGDNIQFLRFPYEVSLKKRNNKWFQYHKGGAYRKWYGNLEHIINWKDNGSLIKMHKSAVVRNSSFYLRPFGGWSSLTSGNFASRLFYEDVIMDQKGPGIYSDTDNIDDIKLFIAYFNCPVFQEIIPIISPTLDYTAGTISRVIPFLKVDFALIQDKVDYCINNSMIEWNSRETSWDFRINELLRIKGQDLEETYDHFCQYWKNKFYQLHQNEEELNRQFIEIYGLQEELTPDVPLEDITILKEEASIENGKLVFHADEILAQFVSYAVGCIFGRYSLDKEGLILANQGETMSDYLSKIGKAASEVSFIPDEDAIIPVLDDEWFEDDIVGRFYEFLKVTYDERDFQKNLTFVEESLGKDIRKYFVKDFYNDHVRRYKKRPIYWMFSSPKGHFNVLVYLHRYTPDTLNNILNNYLREFIQKLKAQRAHFERLQISGTASEQNKATRQIDKLDKMLLDCEEYEREILYPLATERIAIDLDDGVLVNYNKFGKAVKEVKGLNDKKTKEKVRGFDWIDTSQIRD